MLPELHTGAQVGKQIGEAQRLAREWKPKGEKAGGGFPVVAAEILFVVDPGVLLCYPGTTVKRGEGE